MLAVLKGTCVVVEAAIAWVSIADIIIASISKRDLTILWSSVHPVDLSVTFEAVLIYNVIGILSSGASWRACLRSWELLRNSTGSDEEEKG